jgi:hypothetical protein
MGDVEDPVLMVAEPLCKWEATEQGKWCHKHAHDLTWHLKPDHNYLGHRVVITGEITEEDYTVFLLKFGDKV